MQRVFVDVREPFEYNQGHVKGALNVPPTSLMKGAPELHRVSKNSEIVVYCRTGARSNTALHILRSLGYAHLINGVNQQQIEAKYGVR